MINLATKKVYVPVRLHEVDEAGEIVLKKKRKKLRMIKKILIT